MWLKMWDTFRKSLKGVTAEIDKNSKLRKGICEKKDKNNRLTQYNIVSWFKQSFAKKRDKNFNISSRAWKIILPEEDINCKLDHITEHEFNDDHAIFSNIAKLNFLRCILGKDGEKLYYKTGFSRIQIFVEYLSTSTTPL